MILKFRGFNNSPRSVKKNTYHKVICASLLTTALFCESHESFASHQAKIYYLQTTSYKSYKKADAELSRLQKKTHLTGLVRKSKINGATYYQVQFGPYEQFQKAKKTKEEVAKLGQIAFVRSYQPTMMTQATNNTVHTNQPTTLHHPKQKRKPVLSKSLPLYKPTPTMIKTSTANLYGFPYHLRALGQGTVGQQTSFFDGDAMLPLLGNNEWIGYVDGAAKYGHDEAWYASLGGGFRGIYANGIWGAYVFGDRNVSQNNNTFWVVNPGIEAMSTTWDAHINGYIPVSSKVKSFNRAQGQNLGMNTLYFTGHSQYDTLFELGEATGPGIDGEVGYTLPSFFYVRPFIGGYHFNISDGPKINGVEGGIEVPVTSYATVLVHDAYDKVQGNTIMGTLRLTFGALPKTIPADIHNRMLDPIQRHLGAYQTGAGIPIVDVRRNLGTTLIKDNIWFFNEGGSQFISGVNFSSCTYEHPCGVLDQTAIDGINNVASDASFYINTGTYNPQNLGLTLHNGQGFYGRQANFMQEAQGSNRPVINNSFALLGNNTLENLQINGTYTDLTFGGLIGVGVLSTATGSININNSIINAIGSNPAPTLGILGVVSLSDNTNLTINNTEINVINHADSMSGSNTIGVDNFANGQITLNNSTVNVTSNNAAASNNSTYIIDNVFSGGIAINNSKLNGIVNNAANANGSLTGVVSFHDGLVSINDSIVKGALSNGTSSSKLTMIYNYGYGIGQININNSAISGVMKNVSGSQAIGVLNQGTMNIGNSTIVAEILGGAGSSYGISNAHGTVNLATSKVSAATTPVNPANTVTAISNSATLNNEGSNTCFENGVAVTCPSS